MKISKRSYALALAIWASLSSSVWAVGEAQSTTDAGARADAVRGITQAALAEARANGSIQNLDTRLGVTGAQPTLAGNEKLLVGGKQPSDEGTPASIPAPSDAILTLDASAPAESWTWFKPANAEKGLPLPFHTIEGYGGGAITPMAYLVNAGPKNAVFSYPSVAVSYVNLGSKNLEAFTLTETLLGRIELGYGADRFDAGNLRHNIQVATGVDVGRDEVWLHNVNIRGLVLEENSFGQNWVPAFTVGAHLKFNDGIGQINNRLGGALNTIGYSRSYGTDFTATFTKMIPKTLFDRPLVVSAGLRVSDAANLGFLGFSDHYTASFEGNIAYLPTDWLLLAYEFRQKNDPYNTIPGLINGEDNWHAFDVSWIINKHATLVGGYGIFGRLADSRSDAAWWIQLKYEF